MSKLDDLYTLVRLLKEFELPVSPILEYAIKEKEEELRAGPDKSDYDEPVNIEIRPVVERAIPLISFTSIKEEYNKFLCETKSLTTARNYYYIIDNYIRSYINQCIDPEADSVYSFKTASEIRTCIQKLKANGEFMEDNAKKHNALTASINSYLKFLETKENL